LTTAPEELVASTVISAGAVTVGAVASYWKLKAPVPTLPAASGHVPLTEAVAESGPEYVGIEVQEATSLVASEPLTVKSNAWLYQPSWSGSLLGVTVTVGGVASLLIVTDAELDRPALLIAEQGKVVPVVSDVIGAATHPVLVTGVEMSSVTVQLTETSLVYQPLLPAVPTTLGVTTGAVLSIFTVTGAELDKPASFAAEQSKVVPVVSDVSEVATHPVLVTGVEMSSVTVQLTETSLVYQPLLPAVPTTLGVTTSGVASYLKLKVPVPLLPAASVHEPETDALPESGTL
jgi:hypothetical protein